MCFEVVGVVVFLWLWRESFFSFFSFLFIPQITNHITILHVSTLPLHDMKAGVNRVWNGHEHTSSNLLQDWGDRRWGGRIIFEVVIYLVRLKTMSSQPLCLILSSPVDHTSHVVCWECALLTIQNWGLVSSWKRRWRIDFASLDLSIKLLEKTTKNDPAVTLPHHDNLVEIHGAHNGHWWTRCNVSQCRGLRGSRGIKQF